MSCLLIDFLHNFFTDFLHNFYEHPASDTKLGSSWGHENCPVLEGIYPPPPNFSSLGGSKKHSKSSLKNVYIILDTVHNFVEWLARSSI